MFVVASLAGLIGVIAALGRLGFGVGFDIAPIGEDNNWIDMLRQGGGANTARLLWANDHRNPLSPWWYIATRKIILDFDVGLLALRFATSLVLALSAYWMVVAIAGRQSRAFALGLAMLIIFWMANRYTDQIFWNFEGALAASLLSVAAYSQFIVDRRRNYRLYAVSLVLWFLAFTTYTIQCGAVFAIGYLAFQRASLDPVGRPRSVVGRSWIAILDTAPYLVLLGLFLLIWQTTMGPFASAASLRFQVPALLQSLREGVWNSDLAQFYERVVTSPNRLAFVIAAVLCTVLAFLALRWRERGQEAPGIPMRRLVDVAVVVACIAAPTVALESSSETWSPGTRWPMIYQLTTPVLLLSILAILIAGAASRLRAWLWNAAVALSIGIGALFSLGHNRLQTEITKNEKFVHDNVLRLIAEDFALGRKPPMQILIMLEEPNRLRWRSSDTLSPTIARVWLQRDDISFRLVPWYVTPVGDWRSWWPIQFRSDAGGIGNAKLLAVTVPYQQVDILHVNGSTARRVTTAGRSDFNGWEVEWDRTGPITLPGVDSGRLCPLTWSADNDALMEGWSVGERDERGPLRWTISRSARLTLPADCRGRLLLRVVVGFALSTRNIEGLKLRLNGRDLNSRRTLMSDSNYVYEAEIDPGTASSGLLFNLELAVPELDHLKGATREFGIAVRQVQILPIQD
jgi:hypothetical protein